MAFTHTTMQENIYINAGGKKCFTITGLYAADIVYLYVYLMSFSLKSDM